MPEPLSDERLAEIRESLRLPPNLGPPDAECDSGACGGCARCYGPLIKVWGREDVADLLAEIDRLRELADVARLLGPARMVLDRCAEHRHGCADEAARMAQQIVDLIGHPVTDEPPHALVERDTLRAAVDRLRAKAELADALAGAIRAALGRGTVLTSATGALLQRLDALNADDGSTDA